MKKFKKSKKIIYNLKKNSSLIKEGGILEIYYVTSTLENEVKEGYRSIDNLNNYKSLKPSLSEIISLNVGDSINNILELKIYIFSYEIFFNEYLTSNYIFPKKFIKNNKNVLNNN